MGIRIGNMKNNKEVYVIRAEIIKKIDNTIQDEYNDIVEKYGDKYHSIHEGYAVLLEEVEEAENELIHTKNDMQLLWSEIKLFKNENYNDRKRIIGNIESIKDYALKSIYELVQVVAVCKRLENTMEVDE